MILSRAPARITLSGGGSGGGGGVPGVTIISGDVTPAGTFTRDVTAQSFDRKVNLLIEANTVGLDANGLALNWISIKPMDNPPAPPTDQQMIGLAYDFTPAGATFDHGVTATFTYSQSDVPEGVDEADLVITFYDTASGEWIALENIVVDTETNTISGTLTHFTAFAVITMPAPEPVPTTTPTTTPTATPTPTPTPEPEPTTNWWLITGIIAVVLIIGAVTAIMIIRQRRKI